MWKFVWQNVTGTSHSNLQLPCQDACRVSLRDKEEGELLVIACADGAGSAKFADIASALACDEFIRLAGNDTTLQADPSHFDVEHLVDWIKEIHWRLDERALELGTPIRQLATTLLGAVITEHCAYFAQIGDGAIVIRCGDNFAPVFWPQSGEYANTTHFVTDELYLEHVENIKVDKQIDECAVFTDGMERLILQFDTQLVHWPFLESMFSKMRSVDDASVFAQPLSDYLNSADINSRTDDDKTLILATRLSDENARC